VDRPKHPPLGIVEFLVVPILGLVLLVVAYVVARRAGYAVLETLVGSVFYAGWIAWAYRRAPRDPICINVGALLRWPRRHTDWAYIFLVGPLLGVGVSALYLAFLGFSFLAPRIVGEWLATPGPPPVTGVVSYVAIPGEVVENVLGAVAEELIFRGVLLHLWARRFGIRPAVIGTSVLFAAAHRDVIGALVFAIVMAGLYVRTGSLVVPIFAHWLGNTLLDVGAVLFPNEGAPTTLREFRDDWWSLGLLFVVSVAIVAVVLRRAIPGQWQLPRDVHVVREAA